MHSRQLQQIAVFGIFSLLLFFFATLVLGQQYQLLLLAIVSIILVFIGVTMKLEYLLYLTFYVLIAGSSQDYSTRQFVFYLRFGIFALYALRLIPFLREKSLSQNLILSGKKPSLIEFGWVQGLFFLYVGITFLSTTYSINAGLSLQRSIALLALFVATLIYLYQVIDNQEKMEQLLGAMVRATFVMLFVGFVFYLSGHKSAVHGTGRLRLLLYGPNELGYICSIIFPAAYWYYQKVTDKKTKIFCVFGLAAMLAALILTASRGPLFCFIFAGFIQIILAYRKHLFVYIIIGFLVGAVTYIFVPPSVDRLYDVVNKDIIRPDTLSSGSGRLPIWQQSLSISQNRPWLGYGYGTVNELFEAGYFSSVMASFQGMDIHNSYIEILLDVGYLGLMVYLLALFFVLIKSLILLFDHKLSLETRRLVVLLFVSYLSAISSAMFESWLIAPGSIFSFPFYIFIAFLIRLYSLNINPYRNTL